MDSHCAYLSIHAFSKVKIKHYRCIDYAPRSIQQIQTLQTLQILQNYQTLQTNTTLRYTHTWDRPVGVELVDILLSDLHRGGAVEPEIRQAYVLQQHL